MKIALLGTRGIPNHYGGFEQYAELLATYLVAQGWEVTVYNAHNHPYQSKSYKGVQIQHIYDPEKKIGTIGQFIYDLGCIWHSRSQDYDVIYQLGYTSSAVFNFLFSRKNIIVTNMDGMEWKRSKYNKYVQRFLMYSEKIAVRRSDFLVADSLGIKQYLDEKYKLDSFYSAYTATVPDAYSEADLLPYNLLPKTYNLLVARLEPENNIDTILAAHCLNGYSFPLIVIGNLTTNFGIEMAEKYQSFSHIRFIGGVYQKSVLDSIRHYAKMYFHGHSVGGTNPSLLEAMACECAIIAHNNVFNETVLGSDAWYFSKSEDLYQKMLDYEKGGSCFEQFCAANLIKIKTIFSEAYVFESIKNFLSRCTRKL